jgi:hypothetical protein
LYELTLLFLACMLGGNGLSVLTLIGLDCVCELTLEIILPRKDRGSFLNMQVFEVGFSVAVTLFLYRTLHSGSFIWCLPVKTHVRMLIDGKADSLGLFIMYSSSL